MLSLGNFSLLPHSRLFAPPTSTLSPPHPCCTPMQSLGNSWHLGHIALTIPDACVVHAVRHPADTSLSSFQQPKGILRNKPKKACVLPQSEN